MNKPTILRLIKYLSISFLSLVIAAIVLGGGVFSTTLARLLAYPRVN